MTAFHVTETLHTYNGQKSTFIAKAMQTVHQLRIYKRWRLLSRTQFTTTKPVFREHSRDQELRLIWQAACERKWITLRNTLIMVHAQAVFKHEWSSGQDQLYMKNNPPKCKNWLYFYKLGYDLLSNWLYNLKYWSNCMKSRPTLYWLT